MVVALGFIAGATQIQTSFLVDPVGPKTFPMLVGGVAALCALLIILKPDAEPDWPGVKTFIGIGLAHAHPGRLRLYVETSRLSCSYSSCREHAQLPNPAAQIRRLVNRAPGSRQGSILFSSMRLAWGWLPCQNPGWDKPVLHHRSTHP